MSDYPTLAQIKDARKTLGSLIIETPAQQWRDPRLLERIGDNTEVFVKLELFQLTGTFKLRGALNVMLNLEQKQLERGSHCRQCRQSCHCHRLCRKGAWDLGKSSHDQKRKSLAHAVGQGIRG